MVSRHRPICKMADLFPDFSLGILCDPDVLYDLDDENENELLASIEIDNAIRNNTNNSVVESEISEHVQVTDENTEPRPASNNKKRNQRFVSMSSAEIDEVITRAETKNTKDNTKWAIRVFEGKFNTVKMPQVSATVPQTQTRLITLVRYNFVLN